MIDPRFAAVELAARQFHFALVGLDPIPYPADRRDCRAVRQGSVGPEYMAPPERVLVA
jgi:hypothetical protein